MTTLTAMKSATPLASAGNADALGRSASKAKITPRQRVINALTKLVSKSEKMKDGERQAFTAYPKPAKDESTKLKFGIQDGVAKAESDAKKLNKEVKKLQAEIVKLGGEKQAATEEGSRKFFKLSPDYLESVDALQRATQVMSTVGHNAAQVAVLLQRAAARVPGLESVLAKLKAEGHNSDPGAPEVAVYSSQYGGILELLESLLDKFKGELHDVMEADAHEAHELSVVKMILSKSIKEDGSNSAGLCVPNLTMDAAHKIMNDTESKAIKLQSEVDSASSAIAACREDEKSFESSFDEKRLLEGL